MYGKHFASMYTGSMRGKGSAFFAVWGYVISNAVPDRKVGTFVELNPDVIAFLIGEDPKVIREKIEQMCQPDPASRSKAQGGRKLVKLGEYAYQVVNGHIYRAIRDEEERRAQNREAQRRHREKKSAHGPTAEELRNLSIAKTHGQEAADADFDRRQSQGIV